MRENKKSLEQINAEWNALNPQEQEEKLRKVTLTLTNWERIVLKTMKDILTERKAKSET